MEVNTVQAESFFHDAMFAKVRQHGIKVEGENFIILPLCNGFEFKKDNFRLTESTKEYGGGKSRRTVTIFFKGRKIWKWDQNISIGQETCFLTYARLRTLAIGFFLNREGHDTYFPDEGTGVGYESVDISNSRSTFGGFCYREAIITIPDPRSKMSLNEMRMLCISSGGFVVQ